MKLLVYEHVSGGGFAGKPLPTSVLSEGFSMLRTVTADFKAAGHAVSTVLDARIATLNPPVEANCILPVSSSRECEQAIHKLSKSVDADYIIAPESNQTLQSLVANIEQAGVASLNCRASAIASVSDKAAILQHVNEKGLPTPETVLVNALDDAAKIKQCICGSLGFPLIVKPVDGVGCAGLSIVRDEQRLTGAVAKARSESANPRLLAQELVDGVAVSVSLFATGKDALPVSLNKQDVSLKPPTAASTYNGGQVPFDSTLRDEAFAVAKKTVASFDGLRGYVGVDLVLTEKHAVVIEVNPRLTTSYVGLREGAGFNPAQAIINAVLEHKLPTNTQNRGYTVFSKLTAPKPTTAMLQETYRLSEVVAPPFPTAEDDNACALILAHGATLKKAQVELHETKKQLHSIIRSGSK